MLQTFLQAWRIKEVRNSLIFVLIMMVIFRVLANVPLPGINVLALQQFIDASQVLGLLNLFSGGTIRNFSIVALGVAPYITASIIVQLLGMIVPRIEEIQKDGEAGQKRINRWTRYLTVPLAIIQSLALLALMRQSSVPILQTGSLLPVITIIATVTAGTLLLMWMGELITEKKVGNGISLLIAAGILADLPTSASQLWATLDVSQPLPILVYALVGIIIVLGVVFMTEAQRNIPVQYARAARGMNGGMAPGGVASSLPLRVNMTGVIPIIFAVSILLFPTFLAEFLVRARSTTIANAARWVQVTLQNQTIYGILFFLLVVGFTYFYASVVFQPEKISENLQKQGGFIPGIRPGKATTDYLNYVINRITLAGALFLGAIAVLPIIAQAFTGSSSLALGGTSLLIIVSVIIESMKQIEAQVTMRQYDHY